MHQAVSGRRTRTKCRCADATTSRGRTDSRTSPSRDLANRDLDHAPNRDLDHDPSRDLGPNLGRDRLRPACWSSP
jgi:hypothetical protein